MFCAFWALDIAPTLDVPVLLLYSFYSKVKNFNLLNLERGTDLDRPLLVDKSGILPWTSMQK